jgi:hypothetical protein
VPVAVITVLRYGTPLTWQWGTPLLIQSEIIIVAFGSRDVLVTFTKNNARYLDQSTLITRVINVDFGLAVRTAGPESEIYQKYWQ